LGALAKHFRLRNLIVHMHLSLHPDVSVL
jgi:hypothetical protein